MSPFDLFLYVIAGIGGLIAAPVVVLLAAGIIGLSVLGIVALFIVLTEKKP